MFSHAKLCMTSREGPRRLRGTGGSGDENGITKAVVTCGAASCLIALIDMQTVLDFSRP